MTKLTPVAALTPLRRKVLESVARAGIEWDGYVPHGSADWGAIKWLQSAGLVVLAGEGTCCDCDYAAHREEPTTVPLYVTTDAGREWLAREDAK